MPTKALQPWPSQWSQLRDPTWDGEPGSGVNAAENCGPESISACLMYLTGVSLPAGVITDAEYGYGYTGYTDFTHMQQFFQQYCSTPTGLLLAPPATLAQHLKSWIDAGHPGIVLWWADIPNKSGGHFSPVFAYTTDGSGTLVSLTRHNVWNGQMETFSLGDFAAALSIDASGVGAGLCLNRTRALG